MTATGLAVRKIATDYPYPTCAETIKRATVKCRFCGAQLAPAPGGAGTPSPERIARGPRSHTHVDQEPLKSNDNSSASTIMIVLAVVVGLIMMFGLM